ncbi:MAG: Plug domain-containing protein [Lewinellaceae bacterium]|nr:Plug domain-containing protein [Lewinellaceae bacterium]
MPRLLPLPLLLPLLPAHGQQDTTRILPAATIRDARFDRTGLTAWKADSLPLGGVISLADRLLWENPITLRINGPGLLATVSARGAGPTRTPVFWNGLNLQSPQHGVVDVSLLPLWPGDRLEVRYGGQSAAQSSGAMGGTILVEPAFSGGQGFSGIAGGSWEVLAPGMCRPNWGFRTLPSTPQSGRAGNRPTIIFLLPIRRVSAARMSVRTTTEWKKPIFSNSTG